MEKIFLMLLFFSCSYGQKRIQYTNSHLTGQLEINLIKGKEFLLLPEVLNSFELMKMEALKDGVKIKIVSGFRSFNQQKKIWNRKYKKNESLGLSEEKNIMKIIEYSTIPGTSRHHWGTDIDIIDSNIKPEGDVLLPEKFYGNGPYAKLKNWLDKNSEKFGFYLVYTDDDKREGFKHEPWHFSYKPISKDLLEEFLKIDFIKLFTKNGIQGSEYLTSDFIKHYKNKFLLGINSDLKKQQH